MDEKQNLWKQWTAGVYVRHRELGYRGVIDGTTTLEQAFTGEKRNPDGTQYRIRCPDGRVETASWEDLEREGNPSGRPRVEAVEQSHCYACKGPIDYQRGKRHLEVCRWVICPACGACGCAFEGSEPSSEKGHAVTREELERRRVRASEVEPES